MIDVIQIVAIAVSAGLLLLVLELVRRKMLGEEYALVWIAGALALLGLSVWRHALDDLARWLGVYYPPAVLLLVLVLFVFLALLFFSVVVSRQRMQIERLIEDVAILDARLRGGFHAGGEGEPDACRPTEDDVDHDTGPPPTPQFVDRETDLGSSSLLRVVVILAVIASALMMRACRENPAASVEPDNRRASVLLITADTTRADDLGVYGGPVSTPSLASLAAHGVTFDRAFTVATGTTPSHASLMTGSQTSEHGVIDNLTRLAQSNVTLAETLRAAGYHTAAWVSGKPLDHMLALDQGFNDYDDIFGYRSSLGPRSRRERRANETVDRYLEWFAKPTAGPRFAWVHLFDPHQPYAAPSVAATSPTPDGKQEPADGDLLERFFIGSSGWPVFVDNSELVHEPVAVQRAVDDLARSRYRAEVAFLEAQVGRMLRALNAAGAFDDTIVVFVSDHGENFLEDGADMAFDHGGLRHSVTRIAMILKLAGSELAGTRTEMVIGNLDIAPTLLDALDLPAPASWSGRSALPALRAGQGSFRSHLIVEGASRSAVSVRTARWTYVEARADALRPADAAEAPALYDRIADPGELENIFGARPEMAAIMKDRVRRFIADASVSRGRPIDDPALLEQLRRLGYVE